MHFKIQLQALHSFSREVSDKLERRGGGASCSDVQ